MEAGAQRPRRPLSAETPGAAAALARARTAQPSGWWGMVLFLCAEGTLFGILIATYFYLDFGSRSWPPNGIAPPSVALPLIATAGLVLTTVPLAVAAAAARLGLRRRVVWLILSAVVVQACYLALQVLLFRHDLHDFSPKATAYGSIYFTMLAAHHAHVAFGILLELVVVFQVARKGLTNYWLTGVRCAALYWYVVNGLAVLVVLTQLSPSL